MLQSIKKFCINYLNVHVLHAGWIKFLDGLLAMEVLAIGHTRWVAVYQFFQSEQQAKALVLFLLGQSEDR